MSQVETLPATEVFLAYIKYKAYCASIGHERYIISFDRYTVWNRMSMGERS